MIGLIVSNLKGTNPKFKFRIRKGSIKQKDFIEFIKAIKSEIQGKLILVLDNLPMHKSKAVKLFFKSQEKWLTIVWLPPYSPDLNPVEYLWSSAKRSKYLADFNSDIKSNIFRSLCRTGKRIDILNGCLRASGLF